MRLGYSKSDLLNMANTIALVKGQIINPKHENYDQAHQYLGMAIELLDSLIEDIEREGDDD